MDLEALNSLKYAELQHYAKSLGIKANLKAEKLRIAIVAAQQASVSNSSNPDPEKRQSLMLVDQSAVTNDSDEDVVVNGDSANMDDCPVAVDDHLNPAESADQQSAVVLADQNCQILSSSIALDESSFCNITSHSEIDDAEVTINVKCSSDTRRSTYDLEGDKETSAIQLPENDKKRTSQKLNNSSRKPINWSAIHQREFQKMDSLDVFLEKRQQRKRFLKTPPKRAAALHATIAVPHVDTKSVQQSSAKKPKTKEFVPTVFSTANISTNFTAMYGSGAKTPGAFNQQAKENRLATSSVTPGANKSILSTSVVSAKKPVFDLKASLARPLTYTPHYGKLKPLNEKRVDVKTATKANHREQKRQEMKTARDVNRHAALAARRQ